MDGPPTPQLLADLLKRVPHVQALRKIGMGTVLSWLAVAAGLVFSALTFQGFRQSAARLRFGALLVIAMYSLQIVLWPFVMGARGATFLLPWTLPWAWAGWRRLRDTRAHLEASVLIAFLIPANLYFSARIAQVSRGGVHSIEPVARWLQENAGDRVLGVDDNLNASLAERPSLRFRAASASAKRCRNSSAAAGWIGFTTGDTFFVLTAHRSAVPVPICRSSSREAHQCLIALGREVPA